MAPVRCVFCGLLPSSNFGQGEMIRVLSSLISQPFPDWIEENKPISKPICFNFTSNKKSCDCQLFIPDELILSDLDVSVNGHCTLDGYRSCKNNKIVGIDGKPCLRGIPNTLLDSKQKPFGLVHGINDVGWPVGDACRKIDITYLLHSTTPREGEVGSWIYFHHCCASWSNNVHSDAQSKFIGVEETAIKSLENICAFCKKLGASIKCRHEDCENYFHYPCCSASGCLQDLELLEIVCPKHLLQLEQSNFTNTKCLLCENFGDITELIYCTGCGSHFHSTCLEPPLQLSPTVRIGWQCAECKTCLVCNESKDENKMLVCDVCDKGYHTYCLNPPLSNLPKNGFKCQECRVCVDCGIQSTSITLQPQLEFESQDNKFCFSKNELPLKWLNNFTLCDKCSVHRKKVNGSCSVCNKAWRCCLSISVIDECIPKNIDKLAQLSQISLTWQGNRCSKCKKMVHLECDPSIDELISSDYVCSICKDKNTNFNAESPCGIRIPLSPQPSIEATESSCGGDFETTSGLGDDYPPSIGSKDAQMAGISINTTSSLEGGIDYQSLPDATNSNTACFNTTPNNHSEFSMDANTIPAGEKLNSPGGASSFMSSPQSSSTMASSIPSKNNCKKSKKVTCQSANRKRNNKNTGVSSLSKGQTSQINQNIKSGTALAKTVSIKRSITGAGNINQNSNPITGVSREPFLSSLSTTRNRRNKTRKGTVTKYVRSINQRLDWVLETDMKNNDEKDDHNSTIVICSAKDKFTLEQDICLACGSFGLEKNMIVCAQCGQCFHTFCADISKVGKTILERGWRCLDCTVCEGCGENQDENLLLLCDDCDISYHTYCLNPPLKEVPKGGWKCSNCVGCYNCGRTELSPNGKWHANYTLCNSCASINNCPVCTLSYKEGELLIRCSLCTCWSHAGCDNLKTETELDAITENGYQCILCREYHGRLSPSKLLSAEHQNGINVNISNTIFPDSDISMPIDDTIYSDSTKLENSNVVDVEKLFFMDGVVLTEQGVKFVRSNLQKIQAKRSSNNNNKKSAKTNDESTNRLTENEDSCSLPANDADEVIHSTIDPTNNIIKSPPSNSQISDDESTLNLDPSLSSINTSNKVNPSQKCNGKLTKSRRCVNVGVGGFRARPARTSLSKKVVNGTNNTNPSPGEIKNPIPKKRCSKKKSEIEETYPDYLMQAFYGGSLITAKRQKTNPNTEDGISNLPQKNLEKNKKESMKRLNEVMCSIMSPNSTEKSCFNTLLGNGNEIGLNGKTSSSAVNTVLNRLLFTDESDFNNPCCIEDDLGMGKSLNKNDEAGYLISNSGLTLESQEDSLFDKNSIELDEKKDDLNENNLDMKKKEKCLETENMDIAGDQWIKIVNDFIADMGDSPSVSAAVDSINFPEVQDATIVDVNMYKSPSKVDKQKAIDNTNSDLKTEDKLKPQQEIKSVLEPSKENVQSSNETQSKTFNMLGLLPELSLSDIETQLGSMSDDFPDMFREIQTNQQLQQLKANQMMQIKNSQLSNTDSGSKVNSKPPTPNQSRPPSASMGPPISQSPVVTSPLSPRNLMGPPTPQSLNQTNQMEIQKLGNTSHPPRIPQNSFPQISGMLSSQQIHQQNNQLRPMQGGPQQIQQNLNFVQHQQQAQELQFRSQQFKQNLSTGSIQNNQHSILTQQQQQQIFQQQKFQHQQQQPIFPANNQAFIPRNPPLQNHQALQQQIHQNTPPPPPPYPNQNIRPMYSINAAGNDVSPQHQRLQQQQQWQQQNPNQNNSILHSRMMLGQQYYSNQPIMMTNGSMSKPLPQNIINQQMEKQKYNPQIFNNSKQPLQNRQQQQFSPRNPNSVSFPQSPQMTNTNPQQGHQMYPISLSNSSTSSQCQASTPMSGYSASESPAGGGILSPEFNHMNNHSSQANKTIQNANPTASNSKRINFSKWEEDEKLGMMSTIAPVLYANMNIPDIKNQFPDFQTRAKEISKIWRKLCSADRQKCVTQARNNRVNLKTSNTTQNLKPTSPIVQNYQSNSTNLMSPRSLEHSLSGQNQIQQNSVVINNNVHNSGITSPAKLENKQRLIDLLANNKPTVNKQMTLNPNNSDSRQISSNPSPSLNTRASSVDVDESHSSPVLQNQTPQTPNPYAIKSPASVPSKIPNSSTPVVHYSDTSSLTDVPLLVGDEKGCENSNEENVSFEPPVIVTQVGNVQKDKATEKSNAKQNSASCQEDSNPSGSVVISNLGKINNSNSQQTSVGCEIAIPENQLNDSKTNFAQKSNSDINYNNSGLNVQNQSYQNSTLQQNSPSAKTAYQFEKNSLDKSNVNPQMRPKPNIWGHGHALPFQHQHNQCQQQNGYMPRMAINEINDRIRLNNPIQISNLPQQISQQNMNQNIQYQPMPSPKNRNITQNLSGPIITNSASSFNIPHNFNPISNQIISQNILPSQQMPNTPRFSPHQQIQIMNQHNHSLQQIQQNQIQFNPNPQNLPYPSIHSQNPSHNFYQN